jgi:hypothetical protein
MPLTFIVSLPKDRDPQFPMLCIVCQHNQADVRVRLSSHSIGWWLLFTWKFAGLANVTVPACRDCSRLLDRDRFARWLATAGIAIVGLFFMLRIVMEMFGGRVNPATVWLGMFFGLLCLAPLVVWEWKTPLPIELTSYQESVDYIFRHEPYAEEFAKLNGTRILDPWARHRIFGQEKPK